MHRRLRCLAFAMLAAAWLLAALPPPGARAQVGQRCFAETSFCIAGRIREFWEQGGGLPVFGLPTSPQQEERIEGQALQVQWFERNRLELHPENPRPYDVLLGRLGADRLAQLAVDWQQLPRSEAAPGCRYFPETGHNLCGDFLQVWRSSGLELDGRAGKSELESLALFGLPLTDARAEVIASNEYNVQWFERARFELHPELQPPYRVLLGLLGNETHSPLGALFRQAEAGEPFQFVNPPGSFEARLGGEGGCGRTAGPGLRLTFSFTGAGNGGWGVAWNNAPGGSFDAGRYSVLTLWVRGAAPGGFQIGLRDATEREVKVEARDFVTVSPDEWRRLSIPLGRFADAAGTLDISRVRNINFGFNAGHGSGSICFADMAFEAPLAEIFPQADGGQVFDYFNPPGSFSAQLVDSAGCSRTGQYGLRISYEFTRDGFGGWGVHWNNAPGGRLDASRFSALTFWVKGAAPNGFHIGLKDRGEHEVKVDASELVKVNDADWQRVVVPLSRFAQGDQVDITAIRNLNLGFNATHGAGAICVDDIVFE